MRRITVLIAALSIVTLFSGCLAGDDAGPATPILAPSVGPTLPGAGPASPTLAPSAGPTLPGVGPASPALAPSAGPTLPPGSLTQVIGDTFSGDGIDPCSLVSVDEVAEMVGRADLTIWRTMRSNGSRLCEYYTDIDPLASVTVRMESSASHQSLEKEISVYRLIPGSDIEPTDLGDEAYIVQESLYVLKGTSLFVIFAIVDDEPSLQAAEAFAARALKSLPDIVPVHSPSPA